MTDADNFFSNTLQFHGKIKKDRISVPNGFGSGTEERNDIQKRRLLYLPFQTKFGNYIRYRKVEGPISPSYIISVKMLV